MNFTEEQVKRYSRHIILSEVGGKGQEKLCESKVFITGAGGLGSPIALYLAAAGIGTIGIIDDDVVDMSNKVESAKETIEALNPDVKVVPYKERLSSSNIMDIIKDYDLVLDGSDNFPTRFLVNDACFFSKKTLISGSIFRFEGQVTTLKPHDGHPCYRCLYPEPPPLGLVPSCQEAGVLGVLAGTVGVIQATEAVKEVLGMGSSLASHLLIYDALGMKFLKVRTQKDPNCFLCGKEKKITELMDYEQSCTLKI